MRFGAVVVNYHTWDLLDNFIDSMREFYPEYVDSLVIVDVETDSKGLDYYEFDNYRSSTENIGYAGACNMGAQISPASEFIAFFNADTEFVDSDVIPRCIEALEDPEVAVVGPLQYDKRGRITHAGIFGTNTAPRHRAWKQPVSSQVRDERYAVTVSGSAYFTKRSVWEEMSNCDIYQEVFPEATGGFLPTPLYYEETGYSYHVGAHGYKVLYLGSGEMIHDHNKSPLPSGEKSNMAKISRKMFREFCDQHDIPRD